MREPWRCLVCGGVRTTTQCELCDQARCAVCGEPISNARSLFAVCPNGHPYPQSSSTTAESVEAWMALGCPQ